MIYLRVYPTHIALVTVLIINTENINKHTNKRCFKLACQDITNTCGVPQDSLRWRLLWLFICRTTLEVRPSSVGNNLGHYQ